jgi:hypothetical protein
MLTGLLSRFSKYKISDKSEANKGIIPAVIAV